MSASLKSWPILSFLPHELAKNVVQAFVFGGAGNEALVTVRSGDIYALGFNGNGCLGVGDGSSTMEPRKVDILCQKVLVNVAYGSGPHVLAVTDLGELYSWGHGGYGQLGHNEPDKSVPVQVKINLGERKIEQVACGSYHSVAQTTNGEVFGWGSNNCGQLGTGSTSNQSVPKKINGLLNGKRVTSVSCGQSFTVALTDEGELFSWGYNGNGQLGIGNTTNQQTPCKVPIGGSKIITKMLCGMAHVLALSDVGELYGWGANSYGQIGVGSTLNTSIPTLIHTVEERWSDIAAHHYNHISAAVTVTGKVFMWGQCHGLTLLAPRQVAVASLDEVFACFGMPQIMFRPVKLDCDSGPTIKDSLVSAFNDKENADLTFLVEGQAIHVHKAILKIRCDYFRSMLQTHWEENQKSEIEISEFSYTVFKSFLKYLYTDEVDLPPGDAIGLLDLANLYCEEKLKKKCEKLIKQSISVENAAMLLDASIKYNAKDLEEFCFNFITGHMTAVTQTETFKDLDGDTVKSFIIKAGQAGAFKR
eukprot:Seg681.3 transcript_id=Seg681.3/GoldUCD/mRNA.D3Y31 product="RCC1 and BTB domain-containing protein 1" protein_id=Seg681.3/GoldUCD/D3Y31